MQFIIFIKSKKKYKKNKSFWKCHNYPSSFKIVQQYFKNRIFYFLRFSIVFFIFSFSGLLGSSLIASSKSDIAFAILINS